MKDATLMIRLTAEQKSAIQAAAEAAGLTVSAWALSTLLRAAKGKKS